MKQSGIYKIEHIASGRVYVGSAVRFNLRWNNHRDSLRHNKHGNNYLQRAWNKYGPDAFSFSILEYVADKSLLLQREQFWIDKLSAARKPNFNLHGVAGSAYGHKASATTRAKMSIRSRKMNLAAYMRTPEALASFRAAMSSPEVRSKIAAAARARGPVSNEFRTMASVRFKGVPKSPEHRAKIAAALKGKPPSPETRAKMSIAAKSNNNAARNLNSPESLAKRAATRARNKALTLLLKFAATKPCLFQSG